MNKIFSAILLSGIILSCSKKPAVTGQPSLQGTDNVKTALIKGGWVLKHTTLIYSPDLADNSDVEQCKRDDVYKFLSNGDATVHFGGDDCWAGFPNASPAQGNYGTWELQSNGTILKQVIGREIPGFLKDEIIYWNVDFISAAKFRVKRLVVEPGKSYTQIDTYISN